MRLSKDDKNEILKAAWAATIASDVDGLANWLVRNVYALDALPEGKADVPMTEYQPPVTPAQTVPAAPAPADGTNGTVPQALWPRGA
jgi:hypothetical protein